MKKEQRLKNDLNYITYLETKQLEYETELRNLRTELRNLRTENSNYKIDVIARQNKSVYKTSLIVKIITIGNLLIGLLGFVLFSFKLVSIELYLTTLSNLILGISLSMFNYLDERFHSLK